MTLAQQKLIENYNSLRSKIDSKDIGTIIAFCMYFQSDDEILYKEFEQLFQNINITSYIDARKIINLYAKRYNLDPSKDIKQIMHIFLNNTIDEGFSYHLNSSVNFPTIMEQGLGLSAIGVKTDERKDYEILQQNLSSDTFQMLQPFHSEKKGSKVYYSNRPILYARYGDRPEWLKELKLNASIPGVLKAGSQEEALVKNILAKYENKYAGAKKNLFLIPNPLVTKKKEVLEMLSTRMSSEQIISYFLNSVLMEKDLYTTEHIVPNDILSINLDSFDIYYGLENQTTKQTESSHHRS